MGLRGMFKILTRRKMSMLSKLKIYGLFIRERLKNQSKYLETSSRSILHQKLKRFMKKQRNLQII